MCTEYKFASRESGVRERGQAKEESCAECRHHCPVPSDVMALTRRPDQPELSLPSLHLSDHVRQQVRPALPGPPSAHSWLSYSVSLYLDPQIRNWVLFPITLVMVRGQRDLNLITTRIHLHYISGIKNRFL